MQICRLVLDTLALLTIVVAALVVWVVTGAEVLL